MDHTSFIGRDGRRVCIPSIVKANYMIIHISKELVKFYTVSSPSPARVSMVIKDYRMT